MIATRSSLDGLIAALSAIDLSRTPASSIEDVLQATRIDDASLAPFCNFVPGRYTRNCVYRDSSFELLVLCWSATAHSPIHDHGGSRCFVKVARGSLRVDNYAIVAGGRVAGHARLTQLQSDVLNAGAIDVRNPANDVHRVAAAAGDAFSLHVYAKPLDECLVFDVRRQLCRVAVNRYDLRPAG